MFYLFSVLEELIEFTRKKLVSCEYKYKVQLYLQTLLNTKVQNRSMCFHTQPSFVHSAKHIKCTKKKENVQNSPTLYVHLKSQALHVTLSHSFPPPVTVKW